MKQNKTIYFQDCKHFRGDIPCKPHKETGVHCQDCSSYTAQNEIILIIKLGAIGDVLRTTPLLRKIWKEHPKASVWWLTYTPEILTGSIDKVLGFDAESLLLLQATRFSMVINLDKDLPACSLAKLLDSPIKYGFILKEGKPAPINKSAEQKFLTGIFDDISKENDKSYLEEIFEICDMKFEGEEYILDCDKSISWDIPSDGKKIVGLNTGCGQRWTSRLWKDDYWEKLIDLLNQNGYFPLLLGGEKEHEKNLFFSKNTAAFYNGFYNLQKFISLINMCDLVITPVTMSLHIAIGLKKKVLLMNNIFNPKEFELYGNGEIIQPSKPCKCFFSPKCTNPEYFCMESLMPEDVFNTANKLLK